MVEKGLRCSSNINNAPWTLKLVFKVDKKWLSLKYEYTHTHTHTNNFSNVSREFVEIITCGHFNVGGGKKE